MIFNQALSDEDRIMTSYYLSTKWGLESRVDSDGDGFNDSIENSLATDPVDVLSIPTLPDFSDTVDAQISDTSNLDSMEDSLALWLDASNIDLVNNLSLIDGDAIGDWYDLSSNNFHFTQETSSEAPIYDSDGFNGYSSVDFNLDYLENKSVKMMHDFIGNGNQATMFIVMNSLGDTTYDQRLWSNIYSGGRSFEVLLPYVDKQAEFWWGISSSGDVARHDTELSLVPRNEAFLTTGVFDGSESNIFYNGTDQQVQTELSDIVDGQITASYIGLGGGTNQTLYADVAEFIIFNNELSSDQINMVNYYLSTKWGLNDKVDSDGDGFIDIAEETAGTIATDASSYPTLPDFSDNVDAQIGESSGLDSVESNLALWLDASNIDLIDNSTVSNGDGISAWLDLSGNGNHAVQETTASRATYQLSNNSILFDGLNDYFDIPKSMNSSASFKLFIVSQLNTTSSNQSLFMKGDRSSKSNLPYLVSNGANGLGVWINS